MERFGTPLPTLEYQPMPGQRESRYPIPKDRAMQRPKEEPHV